MSRSGDHHLNGADVEGTEGATAVAVPAGIRTTATYDGDGKRRRYEDNQDALLRGVSGTRLRVAG